MVLLLVLLLWPDVNHHTQQTQWDPPTAGAPASAPPPSYQPSADKGAYTGRGVVEATALPVSHSVQHTQPAVQVLSVSAVTLFTWREYRAACSVRRAAERQRSRCGRIDSRHVD